MTKIEKKEKIEKKKTDTEDEIAVAIVNDVLGSMLYPYYYGYGLPWAS